MGSQEDRFVWAVAGDTELAERVVAEIWWAGAPGVVEEDLGEVVKLMVYLPLEPPEAAERILDVLRSFESEGLEVGRPETMSHRDWSEAWKEGLGPVEISPRLVVHPSFVEYAPRAGEAELVIDPGQAFGTGQHESTRLVLEWIDELSVEQAGMDRVLDVGTGTGILAMAALARGARWAVGLDLDPVAVREAAGQASRNRLDSHLALLIGPIEALAPEPFDLVVANLLRSEIWPIAEQVTALVGRRLLLAGLLEEDRAGIIERFSHYGLHWKGSRELTDASANVWWSPLFVRD